MKRYISIEDCVENNNTIILLYYNFGLISDEEIKILYPYLSTPIQKTNTKNIIVLNKWLAKNRKILEYGTK